MTTTARRNSQRVNLKLDMLREYKKTSDGSNEKQGISQGNSRKERGNFLGDTAPQKLGNVSADDLTNNH
jgi:hypothetical protein